MRFAEIRRGFVCSLIAQGFRDKVLNKAYLNLLPSLIPLLIVSAANPEGTIYGLSILQIITALCLPYGLYHEMLHGISDNFFSAKYGGRFNETLTDFWVREVASRQNNSLARYVVSYLRLPITAVLGWPTTFARGKINRVADLITERVGDREKTLCLLGSAYTGKGQNPNLIETFDKFTGGARKRAGWNLKQRW